MPPRNACAVRPAVKGLRPKVVASGAPRRVKGLVRRPATLDDLDEIMRLWKECFPTNTLERHTFKRYIKVTHATVTVLEDREGSLAGLVMYAFYRNSTVMHVLGLAVDPFYRRQGLARSLMQEVVDLSAEVEETCLEVRIDNPGAQMLYLSLGFEIRRIVDGYYWEDGCHAVKMTMKGGKGRQLRAA